MTKPIIYRNYSSHLCQQQISYHSEKCGVGKTAQLLKEAVQLHIDRQMVCITARSIPLCDDIAKRIHQHNPRIPVRVIHTASIKQDIGQSVSASIIEYLQTRSDNAILIITHEALS